ncbi:type VII secretion integral membrane protein EccD [Mycobacterium sp. 21AC1]|uniref:type VII secretion integral membrane protein EccD n=1 Tax=[Mycobacterium] appelbergii TaxID=2939269 RepID=UPI002938D9BB|nr:type VII secretion integral membrane protein EccD [Mycobacterium sp. 21AC1]MDV3127476.1 type VII secretion integral membrane protein EccD [Mycobacterium sp. 21AC1]
MPDALCRVSIHWMDDTDDRPATVDLSLPTALAVGALMPSILDALGARGDVLRRFRLTRIGGSSLNESTTLAQNDIQDGELLLLTAATVPAPYRCEQSVTTVLAVDEPKSRPHPLWRAAACLWSSLLGASALGFAALGVHTGSHIAAAGLAAAATIIAAVAAHRLRPGAPIVAMLNVSVVVQAAVLGFLVVPGGPGAANAFLAAVAGASAGAVLLRVSGDDAALDTVTLTGILAFTVTVAVATAGAVLWPLTVQALGALVSAVALGALTVAPRLSVAMAGLTPRIPGQDDETDIESAPVDDVRVTRGHRSLTGLVIGCCAAAALGTLLIAVSGRHPVTPVAMALTTAVGLALVLRSRSYASRSCRTALLAAGFVGLTATFTLVVVWSPSHASWTGIAVVVVGLAALTPTAPAGPAALRAVDAMEYIALALVAPLACWLAGAFDLVRSLSLL